MTQDDKDKQRKQTKQMHDLEQATATMGEMYPPLWRNIYVRLKEEGFTEQQAMSILKVYIMANCSANGIWVNGTETPDKEP